MQSVMFIGADEAVSDDGAAEREVEGAKGKNEDLQFPIPFE